MSDTNTTPAPTPETDARISETGGVMVSADFARRLERERDEARRYNSELQVAVDFAVNHQREIDALRAVADEMEAALKVFEGMMAESHGIAGYHLNGDIYSWDEGDDPLREKTTNALTRYADLKKENNQTQTGGATPPPKGTQ